MKRVMTVAIVLLLCLMVALPVTADVAGARSPQKDIVVEKAVLNEQDVLPCVVVTTVQQAEKKTTDISQEDRDALVEAYKALSDGSVALPIKGEYAVREIVDIGFKNEGCLAQADHGNKAEVLKQAGVTLTLDLNLGIEAGDKICVMTYIDGVWAEIESAENNGDGTITCVFAGLCPVAIAVVG